MGEKSKEKKEPEKSQNTTNQPTNHRQRTSIGIVVFAFGGMLRTGTGGTSGFGRVCFGAADRQSVLQGSTTVALVVNTDVITPCNGAPFGFFNGHDLFVRLHSGKIKFGGRVRVQ